MKVGSVFTGVTITLDPPAPREEPRGWQPHVQVVAICARCDRRDRDCCCGGAEFGFLTQLAQVVIR